MLATKVCTRCGSARTRKTYSSGARSGKPYWYCGVCAVSRTRAWRESNPERLAEHRAEHLVRQREKTRTDPRWAKDKQLRKIYRLSLEEFEQMLEAQGGVCAACQADAPGGAGTWQVDHDHACCPSRNSCGRCIRGLLCFACNIALGYVKDDAERLRKLVVYLEANRHGSR